MKSLILLISYHFFLFSCIFYETKNPQTSREILRSKIDYLLADSLLENAQIGIFIESLNTHEILYRRNEYKLFIPASNQKLFTSAVALEKLGPEFKFETGFYTDGEISDSTLKGNLIIYGMGDPSISGRYSDQDVLGFFSQWRDTLLILGIKEISGDIIGNESYFSNPRLGYGWWWDDEPFWYAAQISALSFNNNCIDLKIWAGQKEGDSLIVVTDPVTDYIQIINNAYTVHADSPSTLKVTRQRARNVINITDGLPAAKSKEISITVENPALWFLNVLSSVFSAGDINVQGQLKVDNEVFNTEGKQKLFAHYSPELKKLIKILNKESNNFYAEQLYKTLGAVYKNEGSAEKGGEVLTDWTQKIGINESQYINKDGSGLSRANLVSPVAIVTLLRHMYYSNNFPHYLNSMAIAGIDGTLKERMVDNTARVILKAKTGYVSHARNLSGYLNDPQGNLYILVVMVNHYSVPTSYINSLQDKIAGLLADYIQN